MPFIITRDEISAIGADMVIEPVGEKRRGGGVSAKENTLSVVVPAWHGGLSLEEFRLRQRWKAALLEAAGRRCETAVLLMPLDGACGFPKERARRAMMAAVRDFLSKHDMLLYLSVGQSDWPVDKKLLQGVQKYLDDHTPVGFHTQNDWKYTQKRTTKRNKEGDAKYGEDAPERICAPRSLAPQEAFPMQQKHAAPMAASMPAAMRGRSLEDLLDHMGETFSQMLLRLIDERGLKDSVVYKKANIDRRHFSKIRNDADYVPTRKTVFAFAVALELSLDETKELLNRAGYAISPGSRFDVIVSYFLEQKHYNIYEINEVLFSYGQPLLGA